MFSFFCLFTDIFYSYLSFWVLVILVFTNLIKFFYDNKKKKKKKLASNTLPHVVYFYQQLYHYNLLKQRVYFRRKKKKNQSKDILFGRVTMYSSWFFHSLHY